MFRAVRPTIPEPEGFSLSIDRKGTRKQSEAPPMPMRQNSVRGVIKVMMKMQLSKRDMKLWVEQAINVCAWTAAFLQPHVGPLTSPLNGTLGLHGEIKREPVRILLDGGSGVTYISDKWGDFRRRSLLSNSSNRFLNKRRFH